MVACGDAGRAKLATHVLQARPVHVDYVDITLMAKHSSLASPIFLPLGIARTSYLQMSVGCTRQSESELSLHSLARHFSSALA